MRVIHLFLMALSLLTLNVNGIRDRSKRDGLVQWLRSLPVKVDIICLQETHCVSLTECSSWFSSSGFLSVLAPGWIHSCGCVVLYRPSISLLNSWSADGRFLQCEFSFHDKIFRVVCVYAPNCNPARDLFFDGLHSRIDPSIPTVLVEISMLYLIGPEIGVAQTPPPCLEIVLPH